ncbi:Predicted flavoprotein CzcO associated with the cation diffusion facilitator CzcD [Hymenobacter psychrophilus]|uniref:Predicted flavoprotein CzcO associated with the cation diffusion facilitator CzcD n=2 Tax=Hymenobacter psychrophilus TaxID=651662 RepID=A0A1H3B9H1_9BACT|nr:Predicted flavoprotein CzcO associated with the cation diffusion facilitator CzcD [Hymenobacter psychrophilus]
MQGLAGNDHPETLREMLPEPSYLPTVKTKAMDPENELLDVLIVGAGLSGIGAAHVLQRRCPGKTYLILEGRQALGGTWDLFRYPGVRSDSDMHTLGYSFKPWTNPKAIADGPAILDYLHETAHEAGITQHIRFGHKVVRAAWASADACWTVEAEHDGQRRTLRARFLYACSGYYNYEEAHRPEFAGEADFRGRIVQPQFWPENLNYDGQQVVVLGSGATAVTLVPTMAKSAARVTMLQRSPSFIVSQPSEDKIANWLRRHLPGHLAHQLTRWKNVLVQIGLYALARRRPAQAKRQLVGLAARQLGPNYDVATHFTPSYNPWDQRVCLVPDGDLFRALRKGQAAVVTDEIERFTPSGLLLKSGRELPADLVVLATGLKIKLLGGITLSVDGRLIHPADTLSYRGMMLSDVPNLIMAFGYTNASWTLKVDLTANYFCRLLRYLDRHQLAIAVPARPTDLQARPLLDFSSGYVQRATAELPRQGSRRPWFVHQNYLKDLLNIRYTRINDGTLQFGPAGQMPGG